MPSYRLWHAFGGKTAKEGIFTRCKLSLLRLSPSLNAQVGCQARDNMPCLYRQKHRSPIASPYKFKENGGEKSIPIVDKKHDLGICE